jgi:hypothetical protein
MMVVLMLFSKVIHNSLQASNKFPTSSSSSKLNGIELVKATRNLMEWLELKEILIVTRFLGPWKGRSMLKHMPAWSWLRRDVIYKCSSLKTLNGGGFLPYR